MMRRHSTSKLTIDIVLAEQISLDPQKEGVTCRGVTPSRKKEKKKIKKSDARCRVTSNSSSLAC
jgi:hypothetical protein